MSPTTYDGSPPYHSQTFPTPPSTAGFSSHMPTSDMNNQSGTPTSANRDTMDQGDTPMTDAPDYRRSDHERQPSSSSPNATASASATATTASTASYAMPLLCKTAHTISRPHPNLNLISLYRLDAIASTVARKDAVTGEKINKLRKSYEGKVKTLGLPGRNKPTDKPGDLLEYMSWPDEGWYDQRVHGKELERAESGPMMAKLNRALQLNTGRLPADEHEKWKGLLAFEDSSSNRTPALAPTKNPAQQAMLKSQASSLRASAPASPRNPHVGRPDRPNKKRRYDDTSYEGYQDDDGYSTSGLDNSATKKRRKDFSPNFEASGSNFNNGMRGLGVKSS